MFALLRFDLPLLILALAIGLVVARWIFRTPATPPEEREQGPS